VTGRSGASESAIRAGPDPTLREGLAPADGDGGDENGELHGRLSRAGDGGDGKVEWPVSQEHPSRPGPADAIRDAQLGARGAAIRRRWPASLMIV
jgi:hypothetical protein